MKIPRCLKVVCDKSNYISTILLCFVLTAWVVGCAARRPPVPEGPKKRIAVVGFDVVEDTYGVPGIDQKIVDMLSTALFKSGNLILVERDKIDKVLKEQHFQLSGIVDPATAVEIGKTLGAEATVTGAVTELSFHSMPIACFILGWCRAVLEIQCVDSLTGGIFLTTSGKGRSYSLKVLAWIKTSEGNKEVLGVRKDIEKMVNDALRDAVKDAANNIVARMRVTL